MAPVSSSKLMLSPLPEKLFANELLIVSIEFIAETREFLNELKSSSIFVVPLPWADKAINSSRNVSTLIPASSQADVSSGKSLVISLTDISLPFRRVFTNFCWATAKESLFQISERAFAAFPDEVRVESVIEFKVFSNSLIWSLFAFGSNFRISSWFCTFSDFLPISE